MGTGTLKKFNRTGHNVDHVTGIAAVERLTYHFQVVYATVFFKFYELAPGGCITLNKINITVPVMVVQRKLNP